MFRFILRRFLYLIPVLLGITITVFFLMRLSGDPATLMLPIDAPKEAIENFRKEHGLYGPVYVQYSRFVGNAIQGDFGRPIQFYYPALNIFKERFPATIELSLAAMGLAILIGVPLGLISGYFGKGTDTLLMRVVDTMLVFPAFVLVLVTVAVLGPSVLSMIMVIGFVGWASYARLVRGQVLSVREDQYVEACRCLGVGSFRTMFIHILPNIVSPLIVFATFTERVFCYPMRIFDKKERGKWLQMKKT